MLSVFYSGTFLAHLQISSSANYFLKDHIKVLFIRVPFTLHTFNWANYSISILIPDVDIDILNELNQHASVSNLKDHRNNIYLAIKNISFLTSVKL
jgi:hypothetical protein